MIVSGLAESVRDSFKRSCRSSSNSLAEKRVSTIVDALWCVKADCQWSVLLGDRCEKSWWRWCMEKTLKKNGGNL